MHRVFARKHSQTTHHLLLCCLTSKDKRSELITSRPAQWPADGVSALGLGGLGITPWLSHTNARYDKMRHIVSLLDTQHQRAGLWGG